MALKYLPNGNLVPGIHLLTWVAFVEEYGYNQRRRDLIGGLELAMKQLSICGCDIIYVDGSFVTQKENPGDYDACWEDKSITVDFKMLSTKYPVLLRGYHDEQYLMYKGDLRPASLRPNWRYDFLYFFTHDEYDDSEKGIIKLLLQ
jgi:hypothetical protein